MLRTRGNRRHPDSGREPARGRTPQRIARRPDIVGQLRSTPDGSDRISGLYRLGDPADGAATWTALDIPGGPNAATDPVDGISPGGQALKHFSIAADPNDGNSSHLIAVAFVRQRMSVYG